MKWMKLHNCWHFFHMSKQMCSVCSESYFNECKTLSGYHECTDIGGMTWKVCDFCDIRNGTDKDAMEYLQKNIFPMIGFKKEKS